MRVMALDVGDRRVGVAVSDPTGTVALPRTVLDAKLVRRLDPSFKELVAKISPECLVVGLPRTLAGEEGPQAQKIRSQAGQISHGLGVPVEFVDERLSSEEASRRLCEAGLSARERRGKLDMYAAAIFLQAWLDSQSHEGKEIAFG